MATLILFTNQLFELKYIKIRDELGTIYLIEDTLFYSDPERQLSFNRLKLTYQRACMRKYYDYLRQSGYKVVYLEFKPKKLYWAPEIFNRTKSSVVYAFDPIDNLLLSRLNGLPIVFLENPSFCLSTTDLSNYMEENGSLRHSSFYIWYRKLRSILIDKNGKPTGGKYSYDKMNRERIKSAVTWTPLKKYTSSKKYYHEASQYVDKKFAKVSSSYFYTPENIYIYPIDFKSAKAHAKEFIKSKLKSFGKYQDFTDKNSVGMYHSMMSPCINIGILNPQWVISQVIKQFSMKNLYSVEGFIRQLIWREYSRLLYTYKYTDLITANYFGNKKRLSENFYTASTSIEPIDWAIKVAFSYGYLHHIVRLMIVSNFMNLCRIHPDDIYKWFMEFSLDSYDWVMINNVYDMGTYASGGVGVTRPYICSSHYILRMSNFKPDGMWEEVYKKLYYEFIEKNKKKLVGRMKFLKI